eukprot:3958711-Ditylum_brightwellii.AAC.1
MASVFDVDVSNGRAFFTITIKATSGVVKLRTTEGLIFLEGQDNSSYMHLRGLYTSLNSAMSILTYRASPNFYGNDVLDLFVSDEGNVGDGVVLTSKINIPIEILSVYNPDIFVPDYPVICGEEEWCNIPNVTLDDPDRENLINIELSVEHGRLSFLGADTPPLVRLSNKGTRVGDSFQLSGTSQDINSILQSLAYLGAISSNGVVDAIHLIAWSERKEKKNAVALVRIIVANPKNNAPSIHFTKGRYMDDDGCHNTNQSMTQSVESKERNRVNIKCNRLVSIDKIHCFEGTDCPLEGITVADPDSEVLELNLSVQNGNIEIRNSSLSGIHFIEGSTGEPQQLI